MTEAPRPPLDLLPAQADATEEARALLAALFAEVGLPADARRMAALPGELRAAGGEWWVLTLRGVVAGAVGIRPGPAAGQASLCWWGVVQARRGMGLGRWMAEKAVAHARGALGCPAVSAEVAPAMRRAARLLLDMGFQPPAADFDPDAFGQTTRLVLGKSAECGTQSAE